MKDFKRIFPILLILTTLTVSFIPLMTAHTNVYADGESWVTNYSYRKQFTITGSADGNLTNYQLKFTVNRSAGSDANLTTYVGTKAAADYDDIRFTKSDGETLLDYWIESSNASVATVWVEFDSIPTGIPTNFYFYYGNAGATAVTNGTNTFITFDDFERGNNGDAVGGNWTASAGTTISTDHAYGGTRSVKIAGAASPNTMTIARNAGTAYAVRYRIWKEDAGDSQFLHGNGTKAVYFNPNNIEDIRYYDTGWHDTGDITKDAWQLLEVNEFNWTGYTYDLYYNGSQIGNNLAEFTTADANWTNKVYLDCVSTVGNDVYYDDFIIRNWTTNEPVVTAWAAEEEAPTETPTVVTSTATNTSQGSTSVTLNGNLTDLGSGATNATVYFQWGYDTNYGTNTTDQIKEATGIFSDNISSFLRGVVIHYRAVGENINGAAFGDDTTFTVTSNEIAEVLWFQPNNIISGTTLPDRDISDGTQNGVITWGTNPAGITTDTEGPVPTSTPIATPTTGPTTYPSNVPIPSTPPNMFDPGTPTFPGAGIPGEIEDASGLPGLFWFVIPLIIIICIGIFIHDKTKSLAAQLIIMAVVVFFVSVFHIWPMWLMVPFVFCGGACVLAGKVYSY